MQPILLSYEAWFRSNLQKNTGPVGFMQHSGPLDFFERRQKHKFPFLLCAVPLRFITLKFLDFLLLAKNVRIRNVSAATKMRKMSF